MNDRARKPGATVSSDELASNELASDELASDDLDLTRAIKKLTIPAAPVDNAGAANDDSRTALVRDGS